MFAGFVVLGDTLHLSVQTRDASDLLPINADDFPTFRVYSTSGLLANGGGTAAYRHTGSITGATNVSPIVITSVAHGLSTGSRVNISGVGGNTAANGTFTITRVSADTFSLDGSTGNGAYTSGGTWRAAGLYDLEIVASGGNGFEAGETYAVHVSWEISTAARAALFTIQVY